MSSTTVDSNDLIFFYKKKICEHYHSNNFELTAVSHHLSHALCAYHTSNFNNSVILVADGGGEVVGMMEESESIFIGHDNDVYIAEQRFQSSFMHPMARAHNI